MDEDIMIYLSMLMALQNEHFFWQAMDACGPSLGAEIFAFAYDETDIRKTRSALRRLKDHPLTFHGPMRGTELTSAAGTRALADTLDAFRRALALAQEAGAGTMVVHTHERHIQPHEKSALMRQCEENILALAQIAQPCGVTLCIENVSLPHKGAALFDEAEYIALIRRLAPCRALIDVGHACLTGWSLSTLLHQLGGRISGYHLHNNDGQNDLHAWINCGTMNMNSVLSEIYKYDDNPALVLEYDNARGHGLDELLTDIGQIRRSQPKGESTSR